MKVLLLAGLLAVLGLFSQADAQGRREKDQHPPPHLVMERLARMTPEEREQMFAKLPADRRTAIEDRLERYNQLPEQVKRRLAEEYTTFQQLTPEQQENVRKLFRDFNELPEERRREVRRELAKLRHAPPSRRDRLTKSLRYREAFSDAERALMDSLLKALGPGRGPIEGVGGNPE